MPIDLRAYLFPIGILITSLVVLHGLRPSRHLPIKVLLTVWVGTFGAHLVVVWLDLLPLNPASLLVSCTILGALGVIVAGYLSSGFILPYRPTKSGICEGGESGRWERWLDYTLVLLSAGVLGWMAHVGSEIVGGGPVFQALRLLRSNLIYDRADWGPVKYAALAVNVLSVFLLTKNAGRPLRDRIPGYSVFALALGIGILSTQRTMLVMLLVAAFFSDAYRRPLTVRSVSGLTIVLILLFVGVGVGLGKIGGEAVSGVDIVGAAVRSIAEYALAPVSALDWAITHQHGHTDGAYTLRFPIAVLNALGLYRGEPFDLVQQFVRVQVLTNVFTFVHAPWRDFGYGAVAYFLAVGMVLGFLFRLPTRRPSIRTLQGFAYYPILLSFFQDQFLTLTSQWIQTVLVTTSVALIYLVVRREFDRTAN